MKDLGLYDPNGIGGFVRRSIDGGANWTAPASIVPSWLGVGPLLHVDGLVVNGRARRDRAVSVVRLTASTDADTSWATPFMHTSANLGGISPFGRVVGGTMFVHERLWPRPIPGQILQNRSPARPGIAWRARSDGSSPAS